MNLLNISGAFSNNFQQQNYVTKQLEFGSYANYFKNGEKDNSGLELSDYENVDRVYFSDYASSWKENKGHSSVTGMSVEKAIFLANTGKIQEDGSVLFISSYDALQSFRENGLEKEIDYNKIANSLSWLNQYSNLSDPDKPMDIGQNMAATFAVLKYRVEKDYSGTDLENEYERLNEFIQQQSETFALSYAETVGNFFEDSGIAGESDRLYKSMKAYLVEETASLEEQLHTSAQWQELFDSRDSWLYRHTDFMVSNVRAAAKENGATVVPSETEIYSKQRLYELSDLATGAAEILASEGARLMPYNSEEEIGIRYGIMYLKMESLLKKTNASQDYINAIQSKIANKIDKDLNEIDEIFALRRQKHVGSEETDPALNRSAIYNTISSILETYNITGNAFDAIHKGIVDAYNSYIVKNMSSKANRYQDSYFFNSFFASQTSGKKAYSRPTVRQQIYRDMSNYFDLSDERTTFTAKV